MANENNGGECCHKAGRPRNEEVRTRIMDAALALLEEGGYSKVTCEGIAQRAGCGKATIYRWWPNKAAVVINAFVETVSPELPNEKLPSLRDYVTVHLHRFTKVLMSQNGRILVAVIAAAQDDPEVAEAFLSHWMRPRRAVSSRILGEYQSEGQMPKEYDIEQVLDLMYGPLHFLLMARHAKLTPEYSMGLANMLLSGLVPRDAAAPAEGSPLSTQ